MSGRQILDTGGKGIGGYPFGFGNPGKHPLDAFNTNKDGFQNDLGGSAGRAGKYANLMQDTAGASRRQNQNPGYYRGLVNVGPGMLADNMIILETLFRIWSRRPQGTTNPFLDYVFQKIAVTPETLGIMARSMDLIVSEPITVGAHTGGPTFSMQSTGAFATTISLGLSHKFATKSLRTQKGAELYIQYILASVVAFDEQYEALIISVLKSVSNKPIDANIDGNDHIKVSIDDLLKDFLSTFAAVNTNPTAFFERIHTLCTTRLNRLGFRKADMYIASPEHFSGQKIFGVGPNYQQSGEKGLERAAESIVEPTLKADGGTTKCWTLTFFNSALSRTNILTQHACIGSFNSQQQAMGVSGTSRYFHGHDTDKEVTIDDSLENIRENFMDANGKFKELPADAFRGGDNEQENLLELACAKNNLAGKLQSVVGFIVGPDGKPLKKIADIHQKFLPLEMVAGWAKTYGKAGMSIPMTVTSQSATATGEDLDSSQEDANTKVDNARFKISEPVDCDIAAIGVYKSAKEYLKNGDFTRSWGANEADVGWDVFNNASDMTQIALEMITDAKGLDPEKDMEKLIAVGKKWEDFVAEQNLPSIRQYYQNDLSFIKDEGIKNQLKKHKSASKSSESKGHPTRTSSSGSTRVSTASIHVKTADERIAEVDTLKFLTPLENIWVKQYLDHDISYESFHNLRMNGLPLPYRQVTWAPNIVYGGFPVIGVVSGEAGYMGMGDVVIEELVTDNKQKALELDVKVLMFVARPDAIVRRDMTVVTTIKNKDYHGNWLVCKQGADKPGKYTWKPDPASNRGSLFATFDAWTNDIHPIASYFGYHFTPKGFLNPERIIQNETYHHMMAPQVLIELSRTFGTSIKNDKTTTMFRKDHYFGIPGLCCRENSYTVLQDKSKIFHAQSNLWPAHESWMNRSNEKRTATAAVPNSITAGY